MKWKKEFYHLTKINAVEVRNLQDADICDIEVLQGKFDDSDLQQLADQAHNIGAQPLSKNRIAEILRDSLVLSSGPLIAPGVRKHWADVMVGLGILGLIAGLLVPVIFKYQTPPNAPKPAPPAIALADIPAFRVIQAGDVGGAAARGFVGKCALSMLKKGTPIPVDSVSKKPVDLTGQLVIRIALKNAPVLEGHVLPESVTLTLSSRQESSGTTIAGLLLAVDPSSNAPSATLAFTTEKLAQVATWIGSSDAFLSFTAY